MTEKDWAQQARFQMMVFTLFRVVRDLRLSRVPFDTAWVWNFIHREQAKRW